MTQARAGGRGKALTRPCSVTLPRQGEVMTSPVEILTLQDQFAILKQIGYLPDSVHAA